MSVCSQGPTDDANKCEIVSVRFAHVLLCRIGGDGLGTAEQTNTHTDQTPCGDIVPIYNRPNNKACQQACNNQASANTRQQTEIGCCRQRAKTND